jgi:hypothetical protein
MGRVVACALAAVIVAACAAAPAAPQPAESATPVTRAEPAPRATSAPTATPTATPKPLPHVFVIVMENTGFARALRSKSIGGLASRYTLATGYHAIARPSLPNYLAMTSGSTWDVTDNGYYSLPATGIGSQLTAAGISWRAYMEGMTSAGCMRSPYPYALKHNPFAYYGGGCPANVVPFEALDADLEGMTPNFVWITPGLCHDAHDCPIEQAGAWLDALVSRITASRAWSEGGVLFVAWDEGDGGDPNLVPLIIARNNGTPGQTATPYDHYSLLATIEDLFKVPRLGDAKTARSMVELLAAGD